MTLTQFLQQLPGSIAQERGEADRLRPDQQNDTSKEQQVIEEVGRKLKKAMEQPRRHPLEDGVATSPLLTAPAAVGSPLIGRDDETMTE